MRGSFEGSQLIEYNFQLHLITSGVNVSRAGCGLAASRYLPSFLRFGCHGRAAADALDPLPESGSMSTSQQRIYVVDDDELVRAALSVQLQADYDVMGFAAARHFLDAAVALPPGCLILDVRMPGLDGLELQRRLIQRNLHFPIVMMTGHGEVRVAVEAMKAGAVDFIEKPFTREDILASVRLAQDQIAPPHIQRDDAATAKNRLALLSARELEVLGGLVAGLPNKTIAYDLGLSPRTVESHRAHIMSKMQVPSFSALVWLALAAGVPARV
jgi:two-component system response regulator FixJ